jgi:hypothetical protein
MRSLRSHMAIALNSLRRRFATVDILFCDRCEIAAQSLYDRSEIVLQSLRKHFTTAVFAKFFAIAARSLINLCAIILQSLQNHFAETAKALRNRYEITLHSRSVTCDDVV